MKTKNSRTKSLINLMLTLSTMLTALVSVRVNAEVSQAKLAQQSSGLNCATDVFTDNFNSGSLSNWLASNTAISIDTNSLKANINLINPPSIWYANVATSNEISLTTGTYRLAFDAKSNIERRIRIYLQENDFPDFPERWSVTSKLNTALATYSYDFLIAKPSINDAPNLIFDLAQTNGDVWIDNIRLCKLDGNLPNIASPNPATQSSCIRFQDEFSGSSFAPVTGTIPSGLKWVNQVPGIDSAPSDNKFQSPWGSVGPNYFTKEAYRDSNVIWSSTSGLAVITAAPMPPYNWTAGTNNYSLTYASGILQTNRTFTFTPSGNSGYLIEANIRLPNTNDVGFFPAFWMMRSFPANTSIGGLWPPEIDIMEAYSDKPDATYHTDFFTVPSSHLGILGLGKDTQQRRFQNTTSMFDGNFHKYSLKWTSTGLIWYVDGAEVYRSNSVVLAPMYLMLNLQVGTPENKFPVSNTTATMAVDYVRVYDLQCLATSPTATELIRNGSFDSDWVVNKNSPGNATWNWGIIQNSSFTTNTFAITVTNVASSSPQNWHVELQQSIPIVQNQPITVSFQSSSSASGTPVGTVYLVNANGSSYAPPQDYTYLPGVITPTLVFTPNATTSSAFLRFGIGKQLGTYYFDNVSVKTSSSQTPAVELIRNGSFDTVWVVNLKSNAAANWGNIENSSFATNTFAITITNVASSSPQNWHVELQQSIPIVQNQPITVSFQSSSSASGTPVGTVYLVDVNGSSYAPPQDYTYLPGVITPTLVFTPNATTSSAFLRFGVGKQTGTYYFDNVSVKTTP